MRRTTDYIVIHCSDTPPSMDVGASDIDRWHRAKGWFRIGYHFVIRRNGEIEFGREVNQVGAHTLHYNERSVGICLIGGRKENSRQAENNFTPAQFETLEKLVTELEQKFPKANVVGHCQLNKGRECPSFDVPTWMSHRAKPTQKDRDFKPLVYSVLRPGSKGPLVRSLQAKLNRWYVLGVDGFFGPQTQDAVKAFQNREKLIADGIVGDRTWTALLRYD